MPKLATILSIAGLVAAGSAVPAQAQSPIEGTWKTGAESEITISDCQTHYCGHITKIVVPPHIIERYGNNLEAIGTNFTDQLNKDPALRGRPIQGMQILTLRTGRNPAVYDGEIYNPEDGNIYSGFVEVINEDRIRLNGCVLYNLVCRGEEWERVAAPATP